MVVIVTELIGVEPSNDTRHDRFCLSTDRSARDGLGDEGITRGDDDGRARCRTAIVGWARAPRAGVSERRR
jgi:hypothetical protein